MFAAMGQNPIPLSYIPSIRYTLQRLFDPVEM